MKSIRRSTGRSLVGCLTLLFIFAAIAILLSPSSSARRADEADGKKKSRRELRHSRRRP
jgi:hypothetical protein